MSHHSAYISAGSAQHRLELREVRQSILLNFKQSQNAERILKIHDNRVSELKEKV